MLEVLGKLTTEDPFYTDPFGDQCFIGYDPDSQVWVVGAYYTKRPEGDTWKFGDIEFQFDERILNSPETMWDGHIIPGGEKDVHEFIKMYIGEVKTSQDTPDGRRYVIKKPTSHKYTFTPLKDINESA